MHGRKKVCTTEEQKAKINVDQQRKLTFYKTSMATILNSKSVNSFEAASMTLAAKLLTQNPDIYSLWNYRKMAVLNWDKNGICEPKVILDQELELTTKSLKSNPKSYGAWYHRYWVLQHFNNRASDWQNEYELCNSFLSIDDRNFHCWDYRRLILKYLNITTSDEIQFTENCLKENFSNYSAWHHRGTVLDAEFFTNESNINKEIKLIENAAFTDPRDSSSWIYLKWFLKQCKRYNVNYKNIFERLLKTCKDLLELEPDSKWAITTVTLLLEELQIDLNLLNDFYTKLKEIDPNRKGFYVQKADKFKESRSYQC